MNIKDLKIVTGKKKRTRKAGAGRKPKYQERTTTIAFRIPISKADEVRTAVNNLIKSYLA